MIIIRNDKKAINDLKAFLASCFSLKDLGQLKNFLGIEINDSKNGIIINQCKYTLDILQEARLLGTKSAKFFMEQSLKLTYLDGDLLKDPTHCWCLVGKLIYFTITRPKISISFNTISQFM